MREREYDKDLGVGEFKLSLYVILLFEQFIAHYLLIINFIGFILWQVRVLDTLWISNGELLLRIKVFSFILILINDPH